MVWLGVLALVVLFLVQGVRGRLHPLLPILIAGVMSAGVWLMLVKTAALPRSMTSTGLKNAVYKQPLAFSPRAAWLLTPTSLVRVSLPDLRSIVELTLASSDFSPVTGVAWNGRELLVTWFTQTKEGSTDYRGRYGIAGPEGWIAPPRPTPHDEAATPSYWDPLARAFVLVSNAHAARGTDAALRTNNFTFLDEQGKELRTVTNVGAEMGSAFTGYCASEGDVVSTTGSSTCRTKSPIESTSTWTCEHDKGKALPLCPNHLMLIKTPESWVGAGGLARDPALPAPLAEKGYASGYLLGTGLTLRDAEVEPRDLRTAPDSSRLLRLDDGYVLVRHLTDVQARALGHTSEYESIVERYDAQGHFVAQGGVLGMEASSAFLLPSAGEIALLTESFESVARFDLKTMRRLDDPGIVTVLRDRLERGGGPSAIFRGLVQLTIALGPLMPLAIMAWLIAKSRSSSRSITWLAWGYSLLAILGAVALGMTISRYYYL